METVEEIIEQLEEAIIETQTGGMELSQNNEPLVIRSDIDQLKLDQEHTVEVIVLESEIVVSMHIKCYFQQLIFLMTRPVLLCEKETKSL